MQKLKLLQKGMKLNYQHHWCVIQQVFDFLFETIELGLMLNKG